MQLVIHLPPREEQLALNRRRWSEVLSDSILAGLPFRIETNAYGELVLNPPPSGTHSSRQGRLTILLDQYLGGHVLPECPISTIDGVKVSDVGWYSSGRMAAVEGQDAFEIATEICVEILSPSNSAAEMKHKRHLFFEAGADEIWLCDRDGIMEFYQAHSPDTPVTSSARSPDFPRAI